METDFRRIRLLIAGIFFSVLTFMIPSFVYAASHFRGFDAGAEIPLDSPVYGIAQGDQYVHGVSSDGENYLVAWIDEYKPFRERILGVRIDSAGNLLDPIPIVIGETEGLYSTLEISFDGTNYLVLWDNGFEDGATWVSPDGEVLNRFFVAQSYNHPKVAVGQNECMVAWEDFSWVTYNIYASRLDFEGHAVDKNGIMIDSNLIPSYMCDVAFDGTNFLVLWEEHPRFGNLEVFGARVTPAGQVLDPSGFLITERVRDISYFPVATFDGTNYIVAYTDGPDISSDMNVFYRRVSPDGEILDPDGVELISPFSSQRCYEIAFDGTNTLVTWTSFNFGLYGTRLSPSGQILDPSGFLISDSNMASSPIPAIGSDNALIVMSEYMSEDYAVRAKRIDFAGQLLDPYPINISLAANKQTNVAIEFDGENYLIVWEDYRITTTQGDDDYHPDIYGVLIDGQGNLVGNAFPISTKEWHQIRPQVAYNGSYFLVTWIDDSPSGRYLYGTAVTTSGVVINPGGVLLASYWYLYLRHPAIASDGNGFMAVLPNMDLISIDVDEGGNIQIANTISYYGISYPYELFYPDIAFDGANYVTLHERESNITYDNELVYARISPDGTILDPDGIVLSDEEYTTMSIGGGPSGSFVIWNEDGLVGTRISQAGEILDSPPVSIGPAANKFPTVRFNDNGWLLGWKDYSDGFAGKVFNDGTVEQYGGVIVGSFETQVESMDLCSGQAGQAMMAYSRNLTDPAYQEERALARVLATSSDLGLTCTQSSDCTDGYCIDGVCCDSACGNGDQTDCRACSVAAGATQDGVCEPILAGQVCRSAADLCDEAEVCNGTSTLCPQDDAKQAGEVCRTPVGTCDALEFCDGISMSCPQDEVLPTTYVCRPETAPCDETEYCNGSSVLCPIDKLKARGTVCRASADDCDAPEECTGFSKQCPDDELYEAGHVCREQAGPCDVEEACDGSSASCPADEFEPDGTSCDDALFSNGDDSCEGGACLHSGNPCLPGESCDENADSCLPADSDDDDDTSDDDDAGDDDAADDDMNSDDDSSHSSSDDDDDDSGCGM